ncbi:hypothetical protein [Streptomyces abikoensis]|uniref:hypothetical protein n=1 Tax=Streptomyces abikoensis TaxID=97398 RepID=UPI001E492D03|nr:hypothetical protein [Streptomyces abikoensis]
MAAEDEDEDDFDPPLGGLVDFTTADGRTRSLVYYAPYGNINAGSVSGGQHVRNGHHDGDGYLVEVREGLISEQEVAEAQSGFAEPEWFPAASTELGKGVFFLTGQPGTGRRTAALNLLRRHSPPDSTLWAIDGDTDLSSWRPGRAEAGGYLMDGLLPTHRLRPGALRHLRQLLHEAGACLVVVTQDDPELIRDLERHLHVQPFACPPPSPRAVFDARFKVVVPDPADRERLLGALEPGLLDDLLVPELVPSEVVELVTAVAASTEEPVVLSGLRERLSFLAEGEIPQLIKKLHDDPDALAFLLAACVFEGLDYRIVQEEADRLLAVADGALHSLLDPSEGGTGESRQPRPNPRFVFRRSLDDLLRTVRAQRAPKEIHAGSTHPYAVEPVRFTRHRQAETVLRHVWREYGGLSAVLTEWMDQVHGGRELTAPVGRVVGMAAGWGGGRRALRHIGVLAKSEHDSSRSIAAYALGIASEDPVLAGEVKYRLTEWSWSPSPQLRATVAHACGTAFGFSRPDLAMRLLRRVSRGADGEQNLQVNRAVRTSLANLFVSGSQSVVVRHLAEWARRDEADAELALRLFPHLLADASWFQSQLLDGGEFAQPVVELIRRALNHDGMFDMTCHHLVRWCRLAAWAESQREAMTILLSELAQDMQHGVLRLFVVIDRNDDPDLVGRETARTALEAWRVGTPTGSAPANSDLFTERGSQ